MTSFAIQNFGCRVNQAECFSWAEAFERHGLELKRDPACADIVVVNTCTLTGQADRDVRKFIRRVERQNPGAKLVLTGCSVEAEKQAFEEIPQAWLVLANREKEALAEAVMSSIPARQSNVYQPLRARALLKVQDGCDLRCTFCIIPRVRGRSQSASPTEILERARNFLRQGFREIVLCGIHLSSYGRDLEPRSSLLELLRELTELEGLGRIRLSSLDPGFLDEDLAEFITSRPEICPHFHLSLQHGSDGILKRMGRKSRADDYSKMFSRLRRRSPDASLGADIIAGFPGESEEDFEASYDFLARSPLTYLHVFSYSPRPGTPAAAWPQVPGGIKKIRSARLRELSRAKRIAFHRSFSGREIEGVVVRKEKEKAEVLTGNYIRVQLLRCPQEPGQEVRVKIVDVGPGVVTGEVAG